MPASGNQDRRRFARYTLPHMYSRVVVRRTDDDSQNLEGHAYDISSGGIRFELDEPIDPGARISMFIDLPHIGGERSTERRSVCVFGNVVWLEDDEDEPGPSRMAAVFNGFASDIDREQLLGRLKSGRYALAA